MKIETSGNVTHLNMSLDEALRMIEDLARCIDRHHKYGNSLVMTMTATIQKSDQQYAHLLRYQIT